MSDHVENGKDAATNDQVDAKKATRPTIATVAGTGSAADLLKQAVSAGQARIERATGSPSHGNARNMPRYAAIAACGVVLGTTFGLLAAPRPNAVETLSTMQVALDAGRSEAARLNAEAERITRSLATLNEASESARTDAKARDTRLTERVSALEQAVAKRFAAVTETIEKAARDQTAQLVAQLDKRTPAATASTPTAAVAAPIIKAEPVVTGAIAETKPKTDVIPGWALRDVYAGVAILEDRKRRLIEVARGDVVPGIGRVETIERRGRAWVVVTRQGVITPQEW